MVNGKKRGISLLTALIMMLTMAASAVNVFAAEGEGKPSPEIIDEDNGNSVTGGINNLQGGIAAMAAKTTVHQ